MNNSLEPGKCIPGTLGRQVYWTKERMGERKEEQEEAVGSTGKFKHHLSSGEPLSVLGKRA